MSPTEIIEQATNEGLGLSISDDKKIKIIGDQIIIDNWLPLLREHKSEIVVLLKEESRQQRVLEMLATAHGTRYVILVDDATTDPVLVTVGIRGLATFNLSIPHSRYDGLALLQVIEEYSMEETVGGNTQASADRRESSQAHPDEQRKAA